MGLRAFLLTSALVVAGAAPVAAQEGGKAAAVTAFDEARRLSDAGQLAEACLKFAESQRLDAQLGTLLHLADCWERNGQTASAWAGFRDAAELAATRGDTRQALAEERAAALSPRLSKLQIDVAAGNDPSALHIERDNVVVGKGLWGAPIPTDPGPHNIKASAPGKRPWTGSVIIKADGSTATVQIPVLEAEMPRSPEASTEPTQPGVVDSASRSAASEPNLLRDRWPALVAGGVGLIGIGIGAGFGIKSMGKGDDAQQFCDGNACTDARGIQLKKEAINAGTVSTVAFVIGGAALAGAGVLWFTLPFGKRDERQSTTLLVGPTDVAVRGYF